MLLEILHEPDQRLRTKSLKVLPNDSEIGAQLDNMQDTLVHAEGLALAAPQVGILKRALVFDLALLAETAEHLDFKSQVQGLPQTGFWHVVNPEIVWTCSEKESFDEGCLSLPDMRVMVERPRHIRVQLEQGKEREKVELEVHGIYAICIQHEMDHLDGVLTIDYLSPLKKELHLKKLTKLKRECARG